MAKIDLASLKWTLCGWRPFAWRLGKRLESGEEVSADIGPLPARVPASVQQLLLEAGIVRDWNEGLQSLDGEWIEHRHWDFSAWVPAGFVPDESPLILDAPGLDYSGWVLVDCAEVARFEGALIPHRIDLTQQLRDGKAHLLSIVFEEPPREQGQIGYTSQSRYFKPRYPYSWDWCPRVVPVGAWAPVSLLSKGEATCEVSSTCVSLDPGLATGHVSVSVRHAQGDGIVRWKLTLCDGEEALVSVIGDVAEDDTAKLELEVTSPELWWPNGAGAQKRYDVHIHGLDGTGQTCWSAVRKVGFRHVAWRACEDAPADAEPWICVVNGKPVFLRGANWVPPNAVYQDTCREDYVTLITLYRDMGANILRVWGGGILETEDFYDLCDEAGILVWQELPMSSSGVENCPPYSSEAIAKLEEIARVYVSRRGHHPSLLLWSGGNELTWGSHTDMTGIAPVDNTHPCIAALETTLRECDPGRRFIATSPTGPRFCADAAEYGRGLHHDIHGPWGLGGFSGVTFEERLDGWRTYWQADDSLFRSEAGMPGAASAECIRRYADPVLKWPVEGLYWKHTASWWTQWDMCKPEMGSFIDMDAGLDAYVRRTQEVQAAAYAIAARACVDRFPKCGGFIIWMGHDCFPCPANNSVIDYLRKPKPAYHALKEVFLSANLL